MKVERLEGCLDDAPRPGGAKQRPIAVYAEAVLAAHGEPLTISSRTRWCDAGPPHAAEATWSGWLSFPIKVCWHTCAASLNDVSRKEL